VTLAVLLPHPAVTVNTMSSDAGDIIHRVKPAEHRNMANLPILQF
jgi:hypothetical protein